jgi:hypothetical protein
MKLLTGTAHFASFTDAVKYYETYGETIHSVGLKVKEGIIKIGPPPIQKGQKLVVNKEEGRFFIAA